MNLKKSLFELIEKNSIKVEVGGETIYLKKHKDWQVIYPPVNIKSIEEATDENGVIDWKKVKWDKTALIFGSKSNAIKTTIVSGIVLLFAFGAWQLISSYNAVISNPIFQECFKQTGMKLFGV